MSDEDKRKLEAYYKGELSEQEQTEVEQELDKVEAYQTYLDQLIDTRENDSSDNKKQKRLVKKGKWKARLHNAWTALSLFLIAAIVCLMITIAFFSWGEPDRSMVYTDVIKATVATTKPNYTVGSSSTNVGILTSQFNADIRKWIGNEHETVGQIDSSFLFNLSSMNMTDEMNQYPSFIYPEQKGTFDGGDGFEHLEKLPEGTVAELFISFTDYYETDEALKKFEGKNMWPTWFAVDSGLGSKKGTDMPHDLLGFPFSGYHLESLPIDTSGSTQTYGDGEKRDKEFLQALRLMEDYYGITGDIYWSPEDQFINQVDYVEKNGVRIYGAVVTGPTKELLKLKDEKWIGRAQVSDARLWNWTDLN